MISMDKKYRTRDGREVRIYAVDGLPPFSVHGAIYNAAWLQMQWRHDGRASVHGTGFTRDLIEVRTAEDVLKEVLSGKMAKIYPQGIKCSVTIDPSEWGPEICQALRDAAKLRDGE